MLQVSHDVLSPHVSELVKVLLECFKDDSWPVRDGALLSVAHMYTLPLYHSCNSMYMYTCMHACMHAKWTNGQM